MNVYLDYAATTPLDGEVLEKMLPYFTDDFGNPDSLHTFGRKTAYALLCARDRVAATLGVRPDEVYFTSGGTEADNWAVRYLRQKDKGVTVSAIEHHAVLGAGEHVRACASFSSVLPDRSGMVSAFDLDKGITSDTGIACVMAVNNETGVVQPIKEIGRVCRERGVLLFSDCVQAGCSQDLKSLAGEVDALSLSSHKVYGPKGVGALIVKKGVKLSAMISGGEQERGLRGGTSNVAGAVGFSYALERAQRERESFCAHVKALRDQLEERLQSLFPDRITIDGKDAPRAPNISHVTFCGKGSEAVVHKLDLMGIAVSGGAACSAHTALPSHVMLAMGRSEEEALRGVRFSFGRGNRKEEVDYVVHALQQILT